MGIGFLIKEIFFYYFRDLFLDIVESDKDVDLFGVIVVGILDGNENKIFVG